MPKFAHVPLKEALSHAALDATPWSEATARDIARLPFGPHTFWGVPFDIAGRDGDRALAVVGANGGADSMTLPVGDDASYLVFAQFCDSRATDTTPVGNLHSPQTADYASPVVTAPGEHLADYVLVYDDGTERRVPVRRRFEINQVATRMQSAFAARPHQEATLLDHRGPYEKNQWGRMQTNVAIGEFGPLEKVQPVDQSVAPASWSIYALPNPEPGKTVAQLRIEPTGAAAIGIGAITLFSGTAHPLRLNGLQTIAVTSDSPGFDPALAEAAVDMGLIARQRPGTPFDPDSWLNSPVCGWGEAAALEQSGDDLLLDVTATDDATLTINGASLPLADVFSNGERDSADGAIKARILTPQREWLHARVVDSQTGRPTPARVHFRAPDGRYFPPYGHRHEVNDNWFEDYGADLKLGSTSYAYVDGEFQVELPRGEVYAEVSKGFEFAPQRIKLDISPGQKSLEIKLPRIANLRDEGWITADSHTHFITPDTAWLEAQAEGLNIINLLAAQWGDLFTNVGDITGRAGVQSRDDTVVWVGTENRQHFLGHISMLGTKGAPVFPMSTSGPTEGYFGDPTWRAMSEWADECRAKGGLVVVPHFPFPYSEVIAEVVRGRVDGLELRDFWSASMDTFAIHEWYRLLNTGYRVCAIGGTDKMSAGMPVGGVRTYANIGDDGLSFDSWSRAVRAGRTYTTSGPLLSLSVEGHQPGDEIQLPSGGGALHVEAAALATMPFNSLQVVLNGRVVAEEHSAGGTTSARLSDTVDVTGSGWLAARAVSDHIAHHVWPVHFNAHTSPIYLQAGRDEVFDNPTAQYLVTVMEGGLTWLDTLATPAPPERHAAVRAVFEEAITAVKTRAGWDSTRAGHAHPHPHD